MLRRCVMINKQFGLGDDQYYDIMNNIIIQKCYNVNLKNWNIDDEKLEGDGKFEGWKITVGSVERSEMC